MLTFQEDKSKIYEFFKRKNLQKGNLKIPKCETKNKIGLRFDKFTAH